MQLSIARADDDPRAAGRHVSTLLGQFNEEAVGPPTGEYFVLTIKAPGSDEILGGLFAVSYWGSFYISDVVVPLTARRQGLGLELIAAGGAGSACAALSTHVAGHIRVSGASVLRAPRLRGLRAVGRAETLLSPVLLEKDLGAASRQLALRCRSPPTTTLRRRSERPLLGITTRSPRSAYFPM